MNHFFENHLVLFGGTFNPPHLGHVKAVNGLVKDPAVKKVIILPSFGNPLKPETTSFHHRYTMAKLNFPHHEVSPFEADEKTTSTYELLTRSNRIAQNHPIAFAIGADQLLTLKSWFNFPRFLNLSDWLVLLRKPNILEDCGPTLQRLESEGVLKPTQDPYAFSIVNSKPSRRLQIVPTDAPSISSTEIREQIALGKIAEVRKFLNPSVQEYIERNRLYGT